MWKNIKNITKPYRQQLIDATQDIKKHQTHLLNHILNSNQGSLLGTQMSFATIKTYSDYIKQVPIHSYEDIAASIHRMLNGESNICTTEPVEMFEMTSGTTGDAKFIPYTNLSLRAFQKAIYAWLADICTQFPNLMKGKAYFAISPAVRKISYTPTGVPIGTHDDSIYFGEKLRQDLQQIIFNSNVDTQTADFDSWKLATAHSLAQAPCLSLISVWSPTFLLEIIDQILKIYPDFSPRKHWPNLSLVSCWTSSTSAHFAKELKSLIPQATIQGKGLISTEAIASIPLAKSTSPVLAIESNFYEFLDDKKNIHLAHDLKEGESYEIIITNFSGLYRYATNDRVTVTGYFNQAPQIEFIGKTKEFMDLCGEKLSESFVLECFKANDLPINGMIFLSNTQTPKPGYVVLFEAGEYSSLQMDAITQQLDLSLKKNLHYDYARNLGQLMPMQFREYSGLLKKFYKILLNQGKRFGDIKLTPFFPTH